MTQPPVIVRCALRVRGAVEVNAIRPAVYRLARTRGLTGFVRNDGEGVWIEVEGPEVLVSAFPAHVRNAAARLVQLEEIERTELTPRYERTFEVR